MNSEISYNEFLSTKRILHLDTDTARSSTFHLYEKEADVVSFDTSQTWSLSQFHCVPPYLNIKDYYYSRIMSTNEEDIIGNIRIETNNKDIHFRVSSNCKTYYKDDIDKLKEFSKWAVPWANITIEINSLEKLDETTQFTMYYTEYHVIYDGGKKDLTTYYWIQNNKVNVYEDNHK